jgi:hypothetical protein
MAHSRLQGDPTLQRAMQVTPGQCFGYVSEAQDETAGKVCCHLRGQAQKDCKAQSRPHTTALQSVNPLGCFMGKQETEEHILTQDVH